MLPILYFIASLVEIIGELLEKYSIIFYSKIVLMPILMLWAFTTVKHKKSIVFLLLGLFFSWLGDIFLMLKTQQEGEQIKQFFIYGLAAFLIAHVNYIIGFIKQANESTEIGHVTAKPFLVLPFIVFVIGLLSYLGNSIQAVKIPVYLYSVVISCMAIAALNRKTFANTTSFYLIFIGSLFFIFSDSCIAISNFKQPFLGSRVIIMSTYIIAQYLITKGYLEHVSNKVGR